VARDSASTSCSVHTWSVKPAAIAGVHSRHTFAEPRPLVASGASNGLAQAGVRQDEVVGRRGTTLADAASRPRPYTRVDPAPRRRHALTNVEVEALDKRRYSSSSHTLIDLPMAPSVPNTTRVDPDHATMPGLLDHLRLEQPGSASSVADGQGLSLAAFRVTQKPTWPRMAGREPLMPALGCILAERCASGLSCLPSWAMLASGFT